MGRAQGRAAFAANVRHHRMQRGLTQREFAVLVGVSDTTVRNWESGRTGVSADVIHALADALDVSPQELWPGWNDRLGRRGGRMATERRSEAPADLPSPTALERFAETDLSGLPAVQLKALHDYFARLGRALDQVQTQLDEHLREREAGGDPHSPADEVIAAVEDASRAGAPQPGRRRRAA